MTGTGEASSGRSAAGMHAFLFADLRGYTQFAATRGDRAAAELLARYRTLVREQVARHAGAEVRTEGDSFYILFTSVSEAVQCALAIAAAARQASLDDPAFPMNVGIGVHFGETVDTAEGSVGSAVNLAARLASAAGPNEVLVSGVVRSLTGTSSDLRTTSAGRRRLKGFAEPVEVFRASTVGSARPPRRSVPLRLARLAAVPAALLVIVLAGAVLVLSRPAEGPGSTGSPTGTQLAGSPSPSPTTTGERAFVEGVMEPGTYVDREFLPSVRFELVDEWCGGLSNVRRLTTKPGPDLLYMFIPGSDILQDVAGDPCASSQREPDAGFLSLNRVEQVYGATACNDGTTRSIGRSWDALVDYLTTLPGTTVSNRASASFGGIVGVGFDIHVDAGTVCLQSGAPTRAVLVFPTTTIDRISRVPRVAPVWWGEGQYLRLWVVDVSGQLVVATIGHELSTEPVNRAFIDKAYRVIQSLRFLPAS